MAKQKKQKDETATQGAEKHVGSVVLWTGPDGETETFTIERTKTTGGDTYFGYIPEGNVRNRWRPASECELVGVDLDEDGAAPPKREGGQVYMGDTIAKALKDAGYERNGCAAVVGARILAGPDADDEAVAVKIPEAVKKLAKNPEKGLRPSGYFGKDPEESTVEYLCELLGVEHEPMEAPEPVAKTKGKHEIYGYVKEYEPTVAQFCRDHPGVLRAVIQTHGHMALIDVKAVKGATMRHRVKAYCVLDRVGGLE